MCVGWFDYGLLEVEREPKMTKGLKCGTERMKDRLRKLRVGGKLGATGSAGSGTVPDVLVLSRLVDNDGYSASRVPPQFTVTATTLR